MFLLVLLILSALVFPAFLINAIVLRIKDEERTIRYTIYACITFAATVLLLLAAFFHL